jgi:hypothetical protein
LQQEALHPLLVKVTLVVIVPARYMVLAVAAALVLLALQA